MIEGIEAPPTSDEIKHFGAAMASWGSTPLFHIVGVTPECRSLSDVDGDRLAATRIGAEELADLIAPFGAEGGALDVVVFAAPQLSLVEMGQAAKLCDRRRRSDGTDLVVCRSAQVYSDAEAMGYVASIIGFGGTVLTGTCFYQQYAREVGEANGWTRRLSSSAKIVNIPGGYGCKPALAGMADCVASAEAGVVVTGNDLGAEAAR